MEIYVIRDILLGKYNKFVSDVIIGQNLELSCVWYGTIPMKGNIWFNGLLELETGSIGYFSSGATLLEPNQCDDYETYLIKYAMLQIDAFNVYCKKILPNKYLRLFEERNCWIDKGCGGVKKEVFEKALFDYYGDNIQNYSVNNKKMSFVLYESLCMIIRWDDANYYLERLYKWGPIVLRRFDDSNNGRGELLSFLQKYSLAIIPDEWFVSFGNKKKR